MFVFCFMLCRQTGVRLPLLTGKKSLERMAGAVGALIGFLIALSIFSYDGSIDSAPGADSPDILLIDPRALHPEASGITSIPIMQATAHIAGYLSESILPRDIPSSPEEEAFFRGANGSLIRRSSTVVTFTLATIAALVNVRYCGLRLSYWERHF